MENHFVYYFVTVTVMTAGTMLLMWLGEQITDRGIGNGVSLVITIGILARLPNAVPGAFDMFFRARRACRSAAQFLGTGCVAGHSAGAGHRRRHCHHAGAAENSGAIRPARGGAQNVCRAARRSCRLRVNYSGVMPIIFAQSILMFPAAVVAEPGELARQSAVPARFFHRHGHPVELRLGGSI